MICSRCKKNEARVNRTICQECADKVQIKDRLNYIKNKSNKVAAARDYRRLNSDNIRQKDVLRRIRRKLKVISHYSNGANKCELCDETRIGTLTVDHLDGGGKQHVNNVGNIYLYLLKNNYPPRYRILCSNCNIIQYRLSVLSNLSFTNKNIKQRLRMERTKTEFMQRLGGVCECGESNIIILTVHHINNNGSKHRSELSVVGGYEFYRSILKSDDFQNLQCRCFSCNDNEHWHREVNENEWHLYHQKVTNYRQQPGK